MSNTQLELDVTDELFWDPKITDSTEIAASANDDGVVTLRGTVGSFRQKREAKHAAERVYGVTSVKNELQVRILTEARRDDAEVRGAVLQALALDSLVPSTIDAKVNDGYVTLKGTAHWQYERDEAEFLAASILGVVGVDDEVSIVPEGPPVSEVKQKIEKAMKRNAKLDADELAVESNNGTVVLSGVVSSWADHDAAIDAAYAAPGVTLVDDQILVAY